MKRNITVLIMTMLVLAMSPAAVYADDMTFGNDTDKDEIEIVDNAFSDPGVITAIDSPEKTEFSFEFKYILESVLDKLPDTLTVHFGDRTENIKAKWKCDGDYNEVLGEYPFVADMEGYTLAEGLELPRITVTFERELADGPKGDGPLVIRDSQIPALTDSLNMTGDSSATLPSYYNLYADKKLPPIRKQRKGNCWSYATIGAIETDLIHDGKATTDIDLSELHLSYYFFNKYTDPKKCRKDTVTKTGPYGYLSSGSLPEYGVGVLYNLVGAIPEDDAPETLDPKSFKPDASYVVSKDKAQVRNVYYMSNSDSDGIKRAVMEHGGVTIGYCDDDRFYNETTGGYYCSTSAVINHSVMIVGWNDKYSKTKFNTQPKGNGAWLIRNSWGGDGYCHEGYFWMSYYDRSFKSIYGSMVVAIDADTKVFDNCYAYDGSPFSSFDTLSMGDTDTVAATYNVSAGETLKGVGVEIGSLNVTANVTAKNMTTGETVTGTRNTSNVGFYTIEFSRPLEIKEDAVVEVSLNLLTYNEDRAYIAGEDPGKFTYGSYTFNCVVDGGYSFNGEKVGKDEWEYCDLRIKLYTNNIKKIVPVKKVTLSKGKASLKKGKALTLKAKIQPSNATNKAVTWKSSNTKVATVNGKGKVKAKNKGKTTITVTTKDGKKKATCKITVK